MQIFRDQRFFGYRDADSAACFSDIEFIDCEFESCSISITRRPELRTTVRNVVVRNSTAFGCFIKSCLFSDCVLDGLKTGASPLFFWAAAFRHVTLSGKVDSLLVNALVSPYDDELDVQQAFDVANAEFYRDVDWSLDISRGQFKEIDLRGIPGHLVRRDPETQVLITREALTSSPWQELHFVSDITRVILEMSLDAGDPDKVLVAPKRSRHFRAIMEDIRLLRKEHIAVDD